MINYLIKFKDIEDLEVTSTLIQAKSMKDAISILTEKVCFEEELEYVTIVPFPDLLFFNKEQTQKLETLFYEVC